MAEDETNQAPHSPQDARLTSLDERLDRIKAGNEAEARKAQGDPNMRVAQTVIGYLIGGPLGGGLIGWGLDSLFGTKPWLTLLMLFVGFGVGVRNVLRVAKTTPGTAGKEG